MKTVTERERSGQVGSYQEELYGPQDVHGSSECGPQVETDSHCSPKLWTQRTGYHVVGASSYTQTQHKNKVVNRNTHNDPHGVCM